MLRNSFSALSEVSVEELVLEKRRHGEQKRLRRQQQQVTPRWLENDGAGRAALLAKKPRSEPFTQLPGCGPCWAFNDKPKAQRQTSFCKPFYCKSANCCTAETAVAEKAARAPAASTMAAVVTESGEPMGQGVANFGGWLCTVDAEANTAHFKAEGERIRIICVAERLAAEAGNRAQLLVADKVVLATTSETTSTCCPLNEVVKTHDGWQLLSMAIDSGAAETVIPHRLVSQHLLKDTDASRGGLC